MNSVVKINSSFTLV